MRIAFLVLAAALAQEPGKQPVAWTLKKGEKVRYEFNYKLVQGRADRTSEFTLTLVTAVEAGEAKDGTTAATLSFERITYSKIQRGESESYDSSKDKDPGKGSYPKVLSKCVGKSIPFRLAPAGNFAAGDELLKLLKASVAAFPELKDRPKWSENNIKEQARMFEWLLRMGFDTPKGSAGAIGDTWETKFDSKELEDYGGKAVCTAKLKEFRTGEAVIDQTFKFELDRGLAAAVRESGGRGSLTWDTTRGLLKTLGSTCKIQMVGGHDATLTVTIALLPEAK